MKKFLLIAFIALSLILLIAADEPKYSCSLESWQAFEGPNNVAFQGTYFCKYMFEDPDLPYFYMTQSVRLPKQIFVEGP